MTLVTETINCDVTLPNGLELPVGRSFLEFALNKEDVDAVSNHILPKAPILAQLDASGQAVVTLWPNDRGTRGSLYRVNVLVTGGPTIGVEDVRYPFGLLLIEVVSNDR